MDLQTIIVGIILIVALLYIGKLAWQKIGSFSTKNSNCGNDCGCDSKRKA